MAAVKSKSRSAGSKHAKSSAPATDVAFSPSLHTATTADPKLEAETLNACPARPSSLPMATMSLFPCANMLNTRSDGSLKSRNTPRLYTPTNCSKASLNAERPCSTVAPHTAPTESFQISVALPSIGG
eukprot:3939349-Rhodomonas_salina.5